MMMIMEISAKIYVFIFTFNFVIDGMKNWPPAKFNHVFAGGDRGSRKMDNLTSLIVSSLNN